MKVTVTIEVPDSDVDEAILKFVHRMVEVIEVLTPKAPTVNVEPVVIKSPDPVATKNALRFMGFKIMNVQSQLFVRKVNDVLYNVGTKVGKTWSAESQIKRGLSYTFGRPDDLKKTWVGYSDPEKLKNWVMVNITTGEQTSLYDVWARPVKK